MKAISLRQFATLVAHHGPSVSIYLPLHGEQRDRVGDHVLLAKATGQARQELLTMGCARPDVERILAPAYDLPEQAIWRSRRHSLVMLLGLNTQHIISLETEVPFEMDADYRFHLRPLIPWLVESDAFYLLALSEKHAQLYVGDSDKLTELPVTNLPANMQAAVQHTDVQRFQCVTSGGAISTGGRTSTFHGQGGRPDSNKVDLQEYIQRVAHVVDDYLSGQSRPLVLATTAGTAAAWRATSHYAHALQATVEGCPDLSTASLLHETAWPHVMQAMQSGQCERFEKLCHGKSSSLVVEDLARVVPAACSGRVEIMLIDGSKPVYGCLDSANESVEVYSDPTLGDTDLVDLAAVETVKHGGLVFPKSAACGNKPATAPTSCVKALLRY